MLSRIPFWTQVHSMHSPFKSIVEETSREIPNLKMFEVSAACQLCISHFAEEWSLWHFWLFLQLEQWMKPRGQNMSTSFCGLISLCFISLSGISCFFITPQTFPDNINLFDQDSVKKPILSFEHKKPWLDYMRSGLEMSLEFCLSREVPSLGGMWHCFLNFQPSYVKLKQKFTKDCVPIQSVLYLPSIFYNQLHPTSLKTVAVGFTTFNTEKCLEMYQPSQWRHKRGELELELSLVFTLHPSLRVNVTFIETKLRGAGKIVIGHTLNIYHRTSRIVSTRDIHTYTHAVHSWGTYWATPTKAKQHFLSSFSWGGHVILLEAEQSNKFRLIFKPRHSQVLTGSPSPIPQRVSGHEWLSSCQVHVLTVCVLPVTFAINNAWHSCSCWQQFFPSFLQLKGNYPKMTVISPGNYLLIYTFLSPFDGHVHIFHEVTDCYTVCNMTREKDRFNPQPRVFSYQLRWKMATIVSTSFVRVPADLRLTVKLSHPRGFQVFDGPGLQSDQVNHNSSVIHLSSFLALVILYSRNWPDNHPVLSVRKIFWHKFGLTYVGREVSVKLHVPQSSSIELPSCANTGEQVSQKRPLKQIKKSFVNRNIHCAFTLTSETGYINLSMSSLTLSLSLELVASDCLSTDCITGGVAFKDKYAMPFLCANYSSHISGFRLYQTKNIISWHKNNMVVVIFSHKNYNKITLKATITTTPCRGVLLVRGMKHKYPSVLFPSKQLTMILGILFVFRPKSGKESGNETQKLCCSSVPFSELSSVGRLWNDAPQHSPCSLSGG